MDSSGQDGSGAQGWLRSLGGRWEHMAQYSCLRQLQLASIQAGMKLRQRLFIHWHRKLSCYLKISPRKSGTLVCLFHLKGKQQLAIYSMIWKAAPVLIFVFRTMWLSLREMRGTFTVPKRSISSRELTGAYYF